MKREFHVQLFESLPEDLKKEIEKKKKEFENSGKKEKLLEKALYTLKSNNLQDLDLEDLLKILLIKYSLSSRYNSKREEEYKYLSDLLSRLEYKLEEILLVIRRNPLKIYSERFDLLRRFLGNRVMKKLCLFALEEEFSFQDEYKENLLVKKLKECLEKYGENIYEKAKEILKRIKF